MTDYITLRRTVVQQALDALEWASDLNSTAQNYRPLQDSIAALRAELAEPVQEPDHTAEIERAVAAEREACALVCEAVDEADTRYRYDYRRGVLDCAGAIRARGEK